MRVVTTCTKAFGQQHMEQICIREPLNVNDRYAVALKKDGAVVGHLPQKISRICALFIRRGGTIECIVTGTRRY